MINLDHQNIQLHAFLVKLNKICKVKFGLGMNLQPTCAFALDTNLCQINIFYKRKILTLFQNKGFMTSQILILWPSNSFRNFFSALPFKIQFFLFHFLIQNFLFLYTIFQFYKYFFCVYKLWNKLNKLFENLFS